MLKKFIERPVLSTVISVIIVILGILGLVSLPISQYPDIAPPTVQVSATYTGANADVVLNSVLVPLEEQINGVENMTYMTSTAANDGSATITVYFKVGTNPDLAAVNVQNRVSRATSLLPSEVTQAGVTVTKRQSSNLLIFSLYSDDPTYDQTFLQNYAKINLIPQIQRVTGVGDASVFGSRDYSMRIWLKPDVMAAYGLVPSDINTALADQNIEAAPGKFGENSNQSFQYTMKYTGRLKDVSQFGNIVLKSVGNGQQLLLKDVARLELGALSYAGYNLTNGKPAVGVAVAQTAGSNARDVINGSKAVLDDAAKSFPKGIHYVNLVDINQFLDSSISKVLHTLLEAFILVFIVVFIFLQDFRSTLIPAISVPVAIVGTLFFLNLFGFTINLLTLFALILAIGIVVDDAIVVVEAVHAKLDAGYKSARKASIDAMSEISGAIVAITLVMAAVFVPVTFITGSAGVFYKQFGLTLAIAIILSAINALTLSPALCALFLKTHTGEEHMKKGLVQRFYLAFNTGFDAVKNKYERSVKFLSLRRWIAIGIVLFFGAGLWLLMRTTPSSFVPNEDMGTIFANISLPPASSMERSDSASRKVDSIAHTIPGVQNTLRVVGQNFIAGSGSAYSMVILGLKDWDQRKGKGQDINSIIGQLFGKTTNMGDAKVLFFTPPTIQGFGTSGGFEFQLQDKGGHTTDQFYKVATDFLAALGKRPEIQYATTAFNPNFPQYLLTVNVAKCKEAGITPSDVLSAMQGYFGGLYASNFNQFGKQYRVMIQADNEYRTSEASLSKIFVRTSASTTTSGSTTTTTTAMAPISEFITLKRVYGPESISRFNLFTSMSVTGSPNTGFSSGDAIKAVQEIAAQKLPAGYGYEFSGITREELTTGSQSAYIFLLCLVFVYFLLSAQYESYILPLAVLCSLPIGLSGTFLFDKLFDIDNNIYTQVCLIMLIGLLAKNAILIVEFALQRRRKGMDLVQSAIEGAGARLRPILMTSFAFIFGIMPLMFSTGAGAAGNKSIGTGAVGGMLVGTLFGLMVIPALFVIFQGIQEKITRKPNPDDDDADDIAPQAGTPIGPLPGVILLILPLFLFASCQVTHTYKQPATVATTSQYRADSAAHASTTDSVTLADMSWKSLISDTILQRLIQRGLDSNLDLKVALARMRSAEANLRQSKAAFLPTLSVDADYTRSKTSPAQLSGFGSSVSSSSIPTVNQYSLTGSTSWEIDVWGKLRSNKRAYVAAFLQSEAYRRAVQTQLIADIANDYYTLLAYDKELEVTQQTVTVRKNDIETVTALKESAVTTGADVVTSEASRYAAEVTIPDLRLSIREMENTLSLLLGQAPDSIPRGRLEDQQPITDLRTGIPVQLLHNRPDVQEAEYALRNAFELTNAARTYFYPSLTISGTAGWATVNTLKSFFDGTFYGSLVGGLTQPIFNQGLNKQRLRTAQAAQDEALYNFKTSVLTATQEVSNALYSYQTALEKTATRTYQLAALDKAVDYTKELLKYTSNTNYTDVLTAETNLLTAQLSSVNDRLQQLQAIVNLYRALGGGWK